ncbi:TIGR02301 family protein [Bosea sp. 685]|uniref:TIGR02301 family protein n=1 Tax=Bosea sp. 685 TaxID=3080057 RepID=UPI0028936BB8|nr:TIGR02301 family protein [Bosea sp. 685]WNJ91952.1 TIGR02301 family protein [Bosea sp. 685]
MRRGAVLALALIVALSLGEAAAQTQRPAANAPKPTTEPGEPPPPPYEPQLLSLAEIMGSLAYLRTLCAGKEAQDWLVRMTALLDTEGRTPQRRERLTSAYNRGFRAYSATHRACTDGSQEASVRLASEGERLARLLAGRYGG